MQRNLNRLLRRILYSNLYRIPNKKVSVCYRVNNVAIMGFQTLEEIILRHGLVIQAYSHVHGKLLKRARLETTTTHGGQKGQTNIIPIVKLATLNSRLNLTFAYLN